LAVLSTSASIATPGLPVGSIQAFAGANAPTGWLLCDGSAVRRQDYPDLFNTIGTTYGAGDTTTTFNLPDLRGRVPAGKDNMGGTAAGRLTTAVSGIAGTALGTAGGSQNIPDHSHQSYIRLFEYFNDAILGQSGVAGAGGYNARTGTWTTWVHPTTTIGGVTVNDYTGRSTPASTWVSQTNMISEGPSYQQTPQNVQPTLVVNYIVKAVADIARGGWYTQSSPPVVTQLPTNPAIGEEVYYLADLTNGIYWHLRFDGQGTYPWKYVGGPPLYAGNAEGGYGISEIGPTTTYVQTLANSPSITCPLAGDYRTRASAVARFSNSSAALGIWISFAGASAVGWQYADAIMSGYVTGGASGLAANKTGTITTALQTIGLNYINANLGGSGTFYNIRLEATPIRVKAA